MLNVSLVNVSNAVSTPCLIYHAVSVSIVKDDDMIYILQPEASNDDTKLGEVLVRTDWCSIAIILENLTKVRKLNPNLTRVRPPT